MWGAGRGWGRRGKKTLKFGRAMCQKEKSKKNKYKNIPVSKSNIVSEGEEEEKMKTQKILTGEKDKPEQEDSLV